MGGIIVEIYTLELHVKPSLVQWPLRRRIHIPCHLAPDSRCGTVMQYHNEFHFDSAPLASAALRVVTTLGQTLLQHPP
jgi:hypothetical protein